MSVEIYYDKKEIEKANQEGKKVLYRYHDVWSYKEDNTKIVGLFAYIAIRETPKGVWITDPENNKEKWIDVSSCGRRFAYLIKEKAMENFLRRKSKQIKILKHQLAGIRSALFSINKPEQEELTYADEDRDKIATYRRARCVGSSANG